MTYPMASKVPCRNVSSSPEISLESDIVDLHCTADMELPLERELPARPTSRLGFNRTRICEPPLVAPSPVVVEAPEVLYQTEIPNQRWIWAVEVESDITALAPQRETVQQASFDATVQPPYCADATWDAHNGTSPDEDAEVDLDSDYSSCEGSDEDTDTTSLFQDPSLNAMVSSFVNPSEPDWSLNPKYSSLPSPLSPRYVRQLASYRHTPVRHLYRHHGHSRHSLHQLKWFWGTREDRWIEHKAHLCEARAYGGLSVFSSVSPCLRLPTGAVPPHPSETPQKSPSPTLPQLPPISIHPRRGDLFALRDPYCVYIDRYFVGMPMWTMSKTLWMFDVHMATNRLMGGVQEIENGLFEDRSESDSLETSGSHTFSDDSDSTLVESESEGDTARSIDTQDLVDGIDGGIEEPEDKGKAYLCSNLEGEPSSSSTFLETCAEIPTFSGLVPGATKMPHPSTYNLRWATSWYRRWEVLLQLCIDNNPALIPEPNLTTPSPTLIKSQRFFIADDWTDPADEAGGEVEEREEDAMSRNALTVINGEDSEDRSPYHYPS